jgi:uncharacterized protein YjiS (DUF1127 family)
MNILTALPLPFITVLTKTLTWPLRVAAHRRVLNQLGGFDDRELADIGLCRQDLRDVTALPFAVDPTDHLAGRARERAEASLRVTHPSTPPTKAAPRPQAFRVAAE